MLTLGINYSQMHDSSACIVRDGELLFAVAEERLSRVKHDAGFPRLAIQACLDFAGIGAKQLDEVCFGWQTAGPEVPRWGFFGKVRPPGKQLRNWKMATEGGGRHSPSTVIWEEKGVPHIVRTHPQRG